MEIIGGTPNQPSQPILLLSTILGNFFDGCASQNVGVFFEPIHIWRFPARGTQNSGNPSTMDDSWGTPILGHPHITHRF